VGGSGWGINYLRSRAPEPIWIADTGDKIFSSPTVADSTVYIGSDDGNLYAFDTETGDRRWQYSTDAAVTSTPAVSEGRAYVGSNDQRLHAVAVEPGDQLGTFRTRGSIHSGKGGM
jgi:eukaryotic-like serine/threonine-protein kinase